MMDIAIRGFLCGAIAKNALVMVNKYLCGIEIAGIIPIVKIGMAPKI